jgi:arylsulfatase A-like enzyme
MKPRAIVVVLDGLRRDMVGPETTPELHRFSSSATSFTNHRSVFPSATRVVSACFATGSLPARHGLQGNSVALMEDGKLVPHDVGELDFMDHWRAVRGHTFAVPTMAERLARIGQEAMVFNNVSPGAARAHDPDGHGWIFHRVASFGPNRCRLGLGENIADVTCDTAGDRRMTEYFLDRALAGREAALGVLWLGEPDHSQHENILGSPAAMAAIAGADTCFGMVYRAVVRRRAMGDDILLIACSDHGHQSVGRVIDIDAEFVDAGLKGADDPSLLAISNGTSALIYLHPNRNEDAAAVLAFLRSRNWVETVLEGEALAAVGQAAVGGLLCAVPMRSDSRTNEFGVPGTSAAAKPSAGKPDRLGCGQHGGLGSYEQMPFLLIEGRGFAQGAIRAESSSVVDLAPTILGHLGIAGDGCEGRLLQSQSAEFVGGM